MAFLLASCGPHSRTLDRGARRGGAEPALEGGLERVEAALDRGDLSAARAALDAISSRLDGALSRTGRELDAVLHFLMADGPRPAFRVLRKYMTLTRLSRVALAPDQEASRYRSARQWLTAAHAQGTLPERPALDGIYGAALERAQTRLAALSKEDRRVVGVLLPLSGPYRSLGESARRAMELAAGRRGRIKLLFKDTRGDAAAAARLVETLVMEGHAVAIIGPIGSKESVAAVRRATELSIPIVPLSSRAGLPELSSQAFRTRASPSRQGKRLARYAVREMGIKRFGVLISDSSYGWSLAESFWDEVIRLGGSVTAARAYPRGLNSFRGVIGGLFGATGRRKARLSFVGLLIADDHRAVRKILPFFPYWGVRVKRHPGQGLGLQLLGGSGWNHPLMVDVAERVTNNAVFCDTFFPDEADGRIREFVTRFFKRHREPPSPFEAEVYDTTRLVLATVKRRGTTRQTIVERLQALRRFRGVTGEMRFGPTGDVVKDVTILTVDGDQIRLRYPEAEERALRSGH